jgi:hypothetical protein
MPLKPLTRYLLLAIAILFGASLVVLSIVPVNRVALGTRPSPVSTPLAVQHAAYLHLLVHITVFAILTSVTWLALEDPIHRVTGLTIILLLGCGTEYLQHAVYDQPVELADVAVNLLTALLVFGLLEFSLAVHRWHASR